MGGYHIKSLPSQMSEPKSRQISYPVKTDNVPDISCRLSRCHALVNLSPPPPALWPSLFSVLFTPLSAFSICAIKKKYVVAPATAEMHPEIFSSSSFCLPPKVELGGERCGRGTSSLFISVSKSDSTDAFVPPPPSLGDHGGLFRNKRRYYIYLLQTVCE